MLFARSGANCPRRPVTGYLSGYNATETYHLVPNGRYGDLDYAAESRPALNPHDAQWADGLLRTTRLR